MPLARRFGRFGGRRSMMIPARAAGRRPQALPPMRSRSTFGRRPAVSSMMYRRTAQGGFFKSLLKSVSKVVTTVTKVPVIGAIAKAAVSSLPARFRRPLVRSRRRPSPALPRLRSGGFPPRPKPGRILPRLAQLLPGARPRGARRRSRRRSRARSRRRRRSRRRAGPRSNAPPAPGSPRRRRRGGSRRARGCRCRSPCLPLERSRRGSA